jgi:hypothetical protein
VWGSLLLAGVFVALYDVDPVFDVALPGETLIPDPVVEEAYAQCYRERDEEIHATAFGTIDNPDVQKEFISSHRARAASECRERHPEVLVTVREPARFDLVDVRPRFW